MAGRPTKYDPAYCDQLLDHMRQGFSFESFAGVIEVHKDTLYEWVKTYEEFSDAKKVSTELARLFWERQGIDGLYNTTDYDEDGKPLRSKSINATLWIFNMKNRFKDEWRDKQEVENTGNMTLNWQESKTYETKPQTDGGA